MTSNVDNSSSSSSLTQTVLNKYWHSSSKSRTLFLICLVCSLIVIVLSIYLMKSAMIQITFSEADDEDYHQKEENEQKQPSSLIPPSPPVKLPPSSPSISSSFRSLFGLGKTAADEQRERKLKNKLIEESRFNFPLVNVASTSLDSPAPTSRIKSTSSSVSTTSNSRFSHKEKLATSTTTETVGGRTIHSKHYLKMNKQYMADLDAREKQKRDEATAAKNLRVPTEPLRCRRTSALLENHPTMVNKYGHFDEGGWCELITEPVPELSGLSLEEMDFKSRIYFRDTFDDKNGTSPRKWKKISVNPIHSDSTYFDYRASSDGLNWPYSQCPIRHRIICNTSKLRKDQRNPPPPGSNPNDVTKLVKTKALVIFIVSSAPAHSLQRQREDNNLLFFLEHGLIPGNTETALFDGVDFVFAKVQHNANESQDWTSTRFFDCGDFREAQKMQEAFDKNSRGTGFHTNHNNKNSPPPNIRFVMVPKVPCDLCAHAKILEHIGVMRLKQANANHRFVHIMNSDYQQIIMMNNGVQGPFFVNNNNIHRQQKSDNNKNSNQEHTSPPLTTWVDVISMGGRRRIPNPRLGFLQFPLDRRRHVVSRRMLRDPDPDYDQCPVHVVSSISISWEGPVHLQTFFISAPVQIMVKYYFELYTGTCVGGDKDRCILFGEILTARTVLDSSSSTAAYSIGKQFHVRDAGVDAREKQEKYYIPPQNPYTTWHDPCKAIFVKTGGRRPHDLMPLVGEAIGKLERGMIGVNKNNADKNNKKQSVSTMIDRYELGAIQQMFVEKKCSRWRFVNESKLGVN